MKLTNGLVVLMASLLLAACSNVNENANYPFAGDWQGSGVDSQGKEFTFAAKVTNLGDNRYRMLVLDKLDTQKKPLHIMDGVLKDNQFDYTADNGIYVGSGKLGPDVFSGYYKGPVDGDFSMKRKVISKRQ